MPLCTNITEDMVRVAVEHLVPAQHHLCVPDFVHLQLIRLPPLHGVLLGLALQAPLFSVCTAYVVLEQGLGVGLVGAALPGAGVANVGVNTLHVLLPVTSLTKAHLAMFALESSDLLMNSLNVPPPHEHFTLHTAWK